MSTKHCLQYMNKLMLFLICLLFRFISQACYLWMAFDKVWYEGISFSLFFHRPSSLWFAVWFAISLVAVVSQQPNLEGERRWNLHCSSQCRTDVSAFWTLTIRYLDNPKQHHKRDLRRTNRILYCGREVHSALRIRTGFQCQRQQTTSFWSDATSWQQYVFSCGHFVLCG